MKAISLWQPWASAMAYGLKTIETRSWPTKYRGDLAICAAKRALDETGLAVARYNNIPLGSLAFGCVLCVVELYDCWPTERITNLRQPLSLVERELGNYAPGRFAWLTRNCRRLSTPVLITGRQGLWMVPKAVARSFVFADVPTVEEGKETPNV